MAFTLRITFSGLCLFVAEGEPGATTGRMHVLLPGMFGHHDCGSHRHVAALGYDAGSLVQGGPVLGVPSLARLKHLALAFGSGDTASLRLCSQIPDLREITNQPVDPDQLADDTSEKLVSRVTLHAGSISRVAQGVCWEWRPGEFRPIANRVEWEIPDMEGDSLIVTATPLRGSGSPKPLGKLYPTDGVLSLDVFHETAENMPPDALPADRQPALAVGEHPPHFSAFYDVFGSEVQDPVLPRYHGQLEDCPTLEGACPPLPPSMGLSAYTCLVAGVGT
ncbi:MAG TPA: hypothetical protein VEQ60_16825 [Longimicrobium sp.]|nr:hypothetical protein [Longimicrobium sp.]